MASISASIITNTLIKANEKKVVPKRVKSIDERLCFRSFVSRHLKERGLKSSSSFKNAMSSTLFYMVKKISRDVFLSIHDVEKKRKVNTDIVEKLHDYPDLIRDGILNVIETNKRVSKTINEKMIINIVFTHIFNDNGTMKEKIMKLYELMKNKVKDSKSTCNLSLIKKMLKQDSNNRVSSSSLTFVCAVLETFLYEVVSKFNDGTIKMLRSSHLKNIEDEEIKCVLQNCNVVVTDLTNLKPFSSRFTLKKKSVRKITEIMKSSKLVNQVAPVRNALMVTIRYLNEKIKCSSKMTDYIQLIIECLVVRSIFEIKEITTVLQPFKYCEMSRVETCNDTLRNEIQDFFKDPSLKRLCYKGEVYRVTTQFKSDVKIHIVNILYNVVKRIVTNVENDDRKVVTLNDVNRALESMNICIV